MTIENYMKLFDELFFLFWSENFIISILEKYTPILVKSTNTDIVTAVAIKDSFDRFTLIKKALLKAPWIPVNPPKNPLNKPPKGNHFFLNLSF